MTDKIDTGKNLKKIIKALIFCFVLPVFVAVCIFVFKNKSWALISAIIMLVACVPFFLSFEKKATESRRLVIFVVLTSAAVGGRIIFALTPGFKPVSALIIIAGMFLGSEMGFMSGALCALVSNFYFGQGAFTPLQMFAWGLIGLAAGIAAKPLKESKLLLCVFGAVSGAVFSLILDVWTTIFNDNSFNILRYFYHVSATLPLTIIYMISNVIFLAAFSFITVIINRVIKKYDIKL